MELYVYSHKVCTDAQDPVEQYGNWSSQWDFSVSGVHLTDKDSHENSFEKEVFEVPFEAKEGDVLHALVIRHSDGDSFGCASGLGEVLWVFKSEHLGREAVMKARFACGERPSQPGRWGSDRKQASMKFTLENGSSLTIGNPAFDYFCQIESIELVPVVLKP